MVSVCLFKNVGIFRTMAFVQADSVPVDDDDDISSNVVPTTENQRQPAHNTEGIGVKITFPIV